MSKTTLTALNAKISVEKASPASFHQHTFKNSVQILCSACSDGLVSLLGS
jgi:hypothetical protein